MARKGSKRRITPVGVLRYIVAIGVTFLVLFPIAWLVSEAFKPQGQWATDPPIWIPNPLTFENFVLTWSQGGQFALTNTILVGSVSTILAVTIGCLAAYSISRFRTGGENFMFWILQSKMLPPIAVAIPLLLLFRDLSLVDTYPGLILAYTIFNLPLVIWLMKAFFDEIPKELEESAMVDGCSRMSSFWRIVLPVSIPAVAVTAVFSLIYSWNEYLFALVLTKSQIYTLPVRLSMWYNENTAIYWGPQAALCLIGIVPIIVVAFYIQKYLVTGLTLGAIKG